MTTIRDVAHHASVSPITVSRVLNRHESVAATTRSRVERAIEELGYVPNMLGQALRNNRTMVIAHVASDITNPFAIHQIRSVGDAARKQGYTVIFTHTDGSAQLEREQLRSLIERRVDGIVLSPVTNEPESVDIVQRQGLPITVIGYPMPDNDIDVVRCDTRHASQELTDYLIAQGHTNIAMLTGPRTIVTSVERAEGFAAALESAHLDPWPAVFGSYTVESGYRMALEALTSAERPTALVTANNFIAIGAAQAAKELGISIASELSIVTFDNSSNDLVLDPFFTGVIQPVAEMARVATERLLERVAGDFQGPGRDLVLPTTFEVHASTAPPIENPR